MYTDETMWAVSEMAAHAAEKLNKMAEENGKLQEALHIVALQAYHGHNWKRCDCTFCKLARPYIEAEIKIELEKEVRSWKNEENFEDQRLHPNQTKR